MSRSGYGYDYDYDEAEINLYRGAVGSAIRGRRGQQALREILGALDAMPDKALASESLVTADGAYCTLGVLGAQRGMDLKILDPEDPESIAKAFGVAPALVREIVYENDECGGWDAEETPEQRWTRMRHWVICQIKPEGAKA